MGVVTSSIMAGKVEMSTSSVPTTSRFVAGKAQHVLSAPKLTQRASASGRHGGGRWKKRGWSRKRRAEQTFAYVLESSYTIHFGHEGCLAELVTSFRISSRIVVGSNTAASHTKLKVTTAACLDRLALEAVATFEMEHLAISGKWQVQLYAFNPVAAMRLAWSGPVEPVCRCGGIQQCIVINSNRATGVYT